MTHVDGTAPTVAARLAPSSRWAVVVTASGRPSLQVLLDALASQDDDGESGGRPAAVVVVDDRRLTDEGSGPAALRPRLDVPPGGPGVELVVVRSAGRGRAAARNLGWRTAAARVEGLEQVVFVEDDVELPPARATAGAVHRLDALVAVGGFDEGVPRAHREDADLALPVEPWPQAQHTEPLAAVFFDRDGTLVHDVPYNGDPAQVRLVDGAREALARVRAAGLRTGVVTNQSGVARGIITRDQADAVTAEVVRQIGGLDVVMTCPHGPDDACPCRKPGPGMVVEAARRLGVPTSRVAVVGDIAADVWAAVAAGARGVMVPTPVTRSTEVAAARAAAAAGGPVLGVVPDLASAVDLLLGATTPPEGPRDHQPA